jgi:hypothetical protein
MTRCGGRSCRRLLGRSWFNLNPNAGRSHRGRKETAHALTIEREQAIIVRASVMTSAARPAMDHHAADRGAIERDEDKLHTGDPHI